MDAGATSEVKRDARRGPILDVEALFQRGTVQFEAAEIVGKQDHTIARQPLTTLKSPVRLELENVGGSTKINP